MTETRQQLFERLVRPHMRRLYRLAFQLTRSAHDAEDLLQDVLVRLFERVDELSSISDLKPWTSRVLYNRFVDGRRRWRKSRLHVVPWTATDAAPDSPPAEQVPAGDPQPDIQAELAHEMQRMQRALDALSEEHRLAVLLHDAEGYTLEEIAAMTASPVGTVKSRLHRARERLRELTADGTFCR